MAQKLGYIPKKVIYVTQKETTKRLHFDDLDYEILSTKVEPAFVTDPEKEKTVESARNWATGYWDYENRKNVKNNKPFELITENGPLNDVRVVDLEKRSQGGRAYKVIIKDHGHNFYCDLREDVLTEALIECGIQKGGKLNGQYIWSRVGSQMKLIRMGSRLYDVMIEATEENELKPIKASELEVGGVYEGKASRPEIFLGWFNTIKIENTDPYARYGYYGYREPSYKYTELKKVQLWYNLGWGDEEIKEEEDLTSYFRRMINTKEEKMNGGKSRYNFGLGYRPTFIKSRKVIKKVRQHDVGEDFINTLFELFETAYQKEILPDIRSPKSWHTHPILGFSPVYYAKPYVKGEKYVPRDENYLVLSKGLSNLWQ